MNGAKRSAEAVGCKNASIGERSTFEGSNRASGGGRSGSENVGLSNANIGENPMPRKPKGSSARVRRGRENAPSQCSSTRRYGAEVTHAILPGKARTTFNKRVPVPETDTGGRSDQARATVYQKHRSPQSRKTMYKEKDIKYMDFPFVYYMDDPIRKDHGWELFDRLSPRGEP
ncbi:hypothetical protein Dsin_019200 [Dipteronia sinensis]|uniref:Ycf2 N-terminal domain-containing protein n=1 Tax=Dipteronia sinensis TaxID=43782 RepID=A0AAE0E3T8_9ROSI|nr:hypothetical protein Dsin_019200 [Dipteronia sinensis]